MAFMGLKTAADGKPAVLYANTLTAATETALYTCPSASTVRITNASVCNTSTSAAVTVSISLVSQAGTGGATTARVVSAYVLAAGDSLPLKDLLGGHVLGYNTAGDSITALASTATAVFVVSGVVFA